MATLSPLLFNNHMFSLALSLLLPLLLLLLLRNKFSGQKLKLPPSPPRLPVIGNLHQLGKVLHHSLGALSKRYGPLMFLNLGQVPILVVSSPDAVEEIVKSHDAIFSSRPKTTASDILLYSGNSIGFVPCGNYWRQARKVCVSELLSIKRIHSFQFVREEEVEALVNRVRSACPNGEVLNLSQMLADTINNILSRCILGQTYKAEDGSINRAGELSKRLVFQLMAFCVGDFFPSLRWVDNLSGLTSRLKSTFHEFDYFINHVIQQHKVMNTSSTKNDDGDFVDVLLRLQQDSNLDFVPSHDQLKAIIQDMFVAGIESTSTTVEWIMAELVRNPKIMKRAREEVRRVVGKKEKIDMNDINQTEYLKNVVKETMRLHPSAPLLAPRETIASAKIGGYDIPAKTRVLINAWAIQRDPRLWDKPEEFIPERFEKMAIDFSGQDFQLIPFGFGRRRCPGLAFAVVSIEYLIANLLYWFDWALPDGCDTEDLDMNEVHGISARRKVSLHVAPIQFFP